MHTLPLTYWFELTLVDSNTTYFHINFIQSTTFTLSSFINNFSTISLYFNDYTLILLSNFDEINSYTEQSKSLIHYTIPNTRLFYPEAFIATPSFLHSDMWFLHILIYQYWLWFVFIFIIIFFFLMFLMTLRWSTMRFRPKRETRGVSRSKCGDLITATVPVSWAISIIIHESTDAIDFFEGFGTTELAVGVRAYQWGWEYYYPKDLDITYRTRDNKPLVVGNSLKYNFKAANSSLNLKFWRLYQLKNYDLIVNPLNFILVNSNYTSFVDNNTLYTLGLPLNNEMYAFKKIHTISKFKANTYNSLAVNYLQNQTYYNVYSRLNEFSSNDYYQIQRDHQLLLPLTTKSLNLLNLNNDSLGKVFINLLLGPKQFYTCNFHLTGLMDNVKLLGLKKFLTPALADYTPYLFTLKLYDEALMKGDKLISNLATIPLLDVNRLNSHVSNKQININTVGTTLDNYKTPLNLLNNTLNKSLIFDDSNPIKSNIPYFNIFSYDSTTNSPLKDQPFLFTGKDQFINNTLMNAHNLTYYSSNPLNVRLGNIEQLIVQFGDQNTLIQDLYIDNSAKKWQLIDLYEDYYWDSMLGSYAINDYYTIFKGFELFNLQVRYTDTYYKWSPVSTGLFATSLNFNLNYSFNDYIFNKVYLPKNSLTNLYNLTLIQNSIDENYVAFKGYIDLNLKLNIINTLTSTKNFNSIHSLLEHYKYNHDNYYTYLFQNFKDYTPYLTKFKVNIKQISTLDSLESVKSVNSYYLALQKVYRTRFDENRSTTRLDDLSDINNKTPLINVDKPNLFYNVYKNNNAYTKFYFMNTKLNVVSLTNLPVNLNVITYDLPFLISIQSDASRYIWIDWYARWGCVDLQAVSYSKQGLQGLPQFTHTFDFNPNDSEVFMEQENYISRVNLARRLVLPNWTYIPYFYNKTNYTTNFFLDNLNVIGLPSDFINSVYLNYVLSNLNYIVNTEVMHVFLNVFSSVNLPGRNLWQSYNSNNIYYLYLTELLDTLVKREYLYRQYFELTSKIIHIPKNLIGTLDNPIVSDLKSLYNNTNGEDIYKRDIYYNLTSENMNLFLIFNTFEKYLNNYTYKLFYKKFFIKLSNEYNHAFSNAENMKMNYKPLKRGISNMIRIQASGAIAMPSEVRLQILASSKDVIHSWAIPSAGIKIDCIPGYSSHRLAIFFSNGIYWGQCMEICGRYHHWMPIIVYFMKRDLFFLWCLHFVLNKNINDNDSTSYWDLRTPNIVSYDRLVWLKELNLT